MNIATKIDLNLFPMKAKLSNSDYHKHAGIGSSSLKKILRSPAHFMESVKNPEEPTPALVLGNAIHSMILEKELFDSEYIVCPEFSGKGSVAAREEWYLLNGEGKTVLKKEQSDIAEAVAKAVHSNNLCKKLLSVGRAEEAYLSLDKETGVIKKVKPDYLREGHIIVDIKSTIDASFSGFQRQVANFKYHLSAAYYLDVVSEVTGETYDTFVIIAVEKEPPYAIGVYVLDEATISAGRQEYKKALRIYAECKNKNHWPAYAEEIMPLNIPSWAFPEYE